MVRYLDEIEAPRAGEIRDLVERRLGVAALDRVDVEIAGIPAAAVLERRGGLVRRALGLGRESRDVAQDDGELVGTGRGLQLGLADNDAPRARCDGPREVASRSSELADDGRLDGAAAPPAEAGWVIEAPVEDVVGSEPLVLDLDFDSAWRHLERNED